MDLSPAEQRRLLDEFVLDSHELDEIARDLRQFNLFEAAGVTRQELRHSDFLGFLLNPHENHGLGDAFLRRFLQSVLKQSEPGRTDFSVSVLEGWDLTRTTVRREWNDIDILLTNDDHKFVVILENKIGSGEHDLQLKRYWETVTTHFPTWSAVLGLYLTPEGAPPSDTRYERISYHLVNSVLSSVIQSSGSPLSVDVATAIRHYSKMLERHVIEDSEIAKLCRGIYERHSKALDLIFEHRPDRQAEMQAFLEQLIGAESPSLVYEEKSYKSLIRFGFSRWDTPILRQGDGTWTPSLRMLLFEFKNDPAELKLVLTLGPGSPAVRKRIVEWALKEPTFNVTTKGVNKSFNQIWSEQWRSGAAYSEQPLDALKEDLRPLWSKFLSQSLPKIDAAMQTQRWAWDEGPTV